jgi:hypothetical protein
MGRTSLKQMGAVRDQHWLERHPIDYAEELAMAESPWRAGKHLRRQTA